MTPRGAQSLARQIADHALAGVSTPERRILALAGPPAAGKTTVAQALRAELQARGVATGLVAMDGFHMANAVLDARGLRARKGAPDTFDLAGFAALLARLREGEEVLAPIFDRSLDAAICAAEVVSAKDRIVIVEGNYLLLDAPGWRDLSRFWDLSVFLSLAPEVLEARLLERWRVHGLTEAQAVEKAQFNDLPNARRVLAERLPCDLELQSA